mmetsp:Transcript_12716/g.40183  ORF Transcript_12716/g.40183 Transcript_12716/m.40183 type:complete len:425 (-) Transcript_12716:148-1422(-)
MSGSMYDSFGERERDRPRTTGTLPTHPPYTLFMGNLAWNATVEDITVALAPYLVEVNKVVREGDDVATALSDAPGIVDVRIVQDKVTNAPKGHAYVEFANVDCLQAVLEAGKREAVPPTQGDGESSDARPTYQGGVQVAGRSVRLELPGTGAARRGAGRATDGRRRDASPWSRSATGAFGARRSAPFGDDERREHRDRERGDERRDRDRADRDGRDRELTAAKVTHDIPTGPIPEGRKKLVLKPRSVAKAPAAPADGAAPSIFGSAKPVDIAAIERQKEEERAERERRTAEAIAAAMETGAPADKPSAAALAATAAASPPSAASPIVTSPAVADFLAAEPAMTINEGKSRAAPRAARAAPTPKTTVVKKVDADGWTETIVVKEKKHKDKARAEEGAKRPPKAKKEKKNKGVPTTTNLFNLLKDA